MKKSIPILIACFVFGVITVLALSVVSKRTKQAKGSFLREFRQHVIEEQNDLNLGVNSYYLAGAGRNSVFLGNYTVPLHSISLSGISGDTLHHSIRVDGINDEKFWSLRLKVDSPNFFLCDGAVPRIFKGVMSDWKGERFQYDTEFFQDLEPIGPRSFVVRSLLGDENEVSLGRFSDLAPHFTFKPDILEKQVDGYFCTTGYIRVDKESQRIIYLYRYRNEYIVMDSTLEVLSRSTTIDTNSVAKIQVATIHSTGSRQFQTPPLVVNDKCSVAGGYMFVNSAILSNNELANALEEASVIDVYSLKDNSYKFSFYLFDHRSGERLREFMVAGNRLYALFQTRLVIFHIGKEFFPDH